MECDSKFRLFLHTTNEVHTIPSSLVSLTSVMFFQNDRPSVEHTMLDIFLKQEKGTLRSQHCTLRKVGRVLQFFVSFMDFLSFICNLVLNVTFLVK